MKTKTKFNKGDWCFCEFKLQQIMEMDEDRITETSDGNFRLGSNDLSDRCYPLEMEVKQISDSVAHWSKEFFNLKSGALNHPDLNRALIERWVEMCEIRENRKLLTKLYERLDEFGMSVIRKAKDLRYEQVEGVSIFR